jgi:hypothetical protein
MEAPPERDPPAAIEKCGSLVGRGKGLKHWQFGV